MVRLDGIEINLFQNNTNPSVYVDIKPGNSDFPGPGYVPNPNNFREYADPDQYILAPHRRYVCSYIQIPAYNTQFGLDVTILPGFNHCGWNRIKFDVFIQGRLRGAVLTREEVYAVQGMSKLRVSGMVPLNGPANATGGASVGVQPMNFENPGQYLDSRQTNAATVIIEVRFCHEKNDGGQELSSMLQTFVWRYRDPIHMLQLGLSDKLFGPGAPLPNPTQGPPAPARAALNQGVPNTGLAMTRAGGGVGGPYPAANNYGGIGARGTPAPVVATGGVPYQGAQGQGQVASNNFVPVGGARVPAGGGPAQQGTRVPVQAPAPVLGLPAGGPALLNQNGKRGGDATQNTASAKKSRAEGPEATKNGEPDAADRSLLPYLDQLKKATYGN